MNLEEAYGLLNNIYVNFSKSAKSYYVYSYRPQYDTVTKRTLKKDVTSIGKIFSETGLGEITFNSSFLNAHPGFVNLSVVRTGKNKIHIETKNTDKAASTQKSESILDARHMKIGASYFIHKIPNLLH